MEEDEVELDISNPLASNDLVIEKLGEFLIFSELKLGRLTCKKWNEIFVRILKIKFSSVTKAICLNYPDDLLNFNYTFEPYAYRIVSNKYIFLPKTSWNLVHEESIENFHIFFSNFASSIKNLHVELKGDYKITKEILENYGGLIATLKLDFSKDFLNENKKEIFTNNNNNELINLTKLSLSKNFLDTNMINFNLNLIKNAPNLTGLELNNCDLNLSKCLSSIFNLDAFTNIQNLELIELSEAAFKSLAEKNQKFKSIKIFIKKTNVEVLNSFLIRQSQSLEYMYLQCRELYPKNINLIFPKMDNLKSLRIKESLAQYLSPIIYSEIFPKLEEFYLKTDGFFSQSTRENLFSSQPPCSSLTKMILENIYYQDYFYKILEDLFSIFHNVKILHIINSNNYSEHNDLFPKVWTFWTETLEEFCIEFRRVVGYDNSYLSHLENKFTGTSIKESSSLESENTLSILNWKGLKKLRIKLENSPSIRVTDCLTDFSGDLLLKLENLEELILDKRLHTKFLKKFSDKCIAGLKEKIRRLELD